MVSPISSDKITSQASEQSRTTQRDTNSSPSSEHAEEALSLETTDSVQVSDAGKLLSQSDTRSNGEHRINSYEQALAAIDSLKNSFTENSAAAAAHGTKTDQLSGLLQSAPA